MAGRQKSTAERKRLSIIAGYNAGDSLAGPPRPCSEGSGMAAWTLPPELDQPLPRMVKRKRSFTLLLIFQTGMFALLLLVLVGMAASNYFKAQTLKERGTRADGTVTKLYTTTGKNSTYYNVMYSYPVSPKPTYSATDQTNVRYFNELRV